MSDERRGRSIPLNADAVVASLQSIIDERDRLRDEIGRLADDIEVWKARCREALERPGCARCEALESERDRARDALEGKVWEPTLEAALRNAIERCEADLGGRDDWVPCNTRLERFKCPSCRDALALLDRLSPQEPTKAAGPES